MVSVGVVRVVVVGVVGVVTSGGGTYRPTVRVTTDFGSACALPAGSCDMHEPVERLVLGLLAHDGDPEAGRDQASRARRGPSGAETSGTVTVVGPFETDRVTGEPFEAVELPGGLWSTT